MKWLPNFLGYSAAAVVAVVGAVLTAELTFSQTSPSNIFASITSESSEFRVPNSELEGRNNNSSLNTPNYSLPLPLSPITTTKEKQPYIQPIHTITVTLTSPEDLKVKEGQRIKQGDVISDRTQARQKLEAKKKQLEIAVEQMSLPITAAAPLPPPNYEVEMAAVKKAKFNLEQAEAAYANYPESKFLDPFLSEIHEPERIKELAQLKERKFA